MQYSDTNKNPNVRICAIEELMFSSVARHPPCDPEYTQSYIQYGQIRFMKHISRSLKIVCFNLTMHFLNQIHDFI